MSSIWIDNCKLQIINANKMVIIFDQAACSEQFEDIEVGQWWTIPHNKSDPCVV